MKMCGILGGMGPDVTVEMLNRILAQTPAAKEQDHIPLLVNHNPRIPDRTAAIVHGGEDPLPHLLGSIDALVRAGADFIAIPCNTAHFFYDEMQAASPAPIIHMPRETVARCTEVQPGLKRVGLLATTGTVHSRLYQDLFEKEGVQLVPPSESRQQTVMDNIMAIKAREALPPITKSMLAVADSLVSDGAELVLVGCTDISIVVKEGDLSVPVVDALSVLVDRVIGEALVS
jgi:aspartate racemase